MRHTIKILAAAAVMASFASQQVAQASFFGLPKILRYQVERIRFAAPALPPMAYTRFCIQYADECEVHHIAFRGGGFVLTARRWAELRSVNAQVNRSIKPERNMAGVAGERWLVAPVSGDCNDYAVTKRHDLLALGWPSRALLLAEVVTTWGEHHLVLVIRTRDGDLVADSLNANIKPWSMTRYDWVRVQSPRNPKFWSTVATGFAA